MADLAVLGQALLPLAREAGDAIMAVYRQADFAVTHKDDHSPLTAADTAAHRVIAAGLPALEDLPLLSEEGATIDYEARRHWSRYWLVDPLDGTREFVARTGEFTVNIALIEDQKPALGVVYLPVTGEAFLGIPGTGEGWCYDAEGAHRLQVRSASARLAAGQPLVMLGSRRSALQAAQRLQARLKLALEAEAVGSSLKFCRIAQGRADLYPRLGDTNEWDTAAGQAVLEAAGGQIVDTDFQPLRYNRGPSLLNPHFYALGDPAFNWRERLTGN